MAPKLLQFIKGQNTSNYASVKELIEDAVGIKSAMSKAVTRPNPPKLLTSELLPNLNLKKADIFRSSCQPQKNTQKNEMTKNYFLSKIKQLKANA